MRMGFLRVKNETIIFADESAHMLIAALKPIVGKRLTDIVPGFHFPEKKENPHCRYLKIAHNEFIVHDVSFPPPADYLLVTIIEPYNKDNTVVGSDSLKQVYKEVDSILESLHDDVVITDGNGVVLHVSPVFLELYSVSKEEILGKTVYELEKQKVFDPSIAAIVLQKREETTILQKTKRGEQLVITGVPVFNKENKISRVVSYSRNVPEFYRIKKQYEELEKQIKALSSEIRELRGKETRFPEIVAKSPQMKNILELALKVAEVDINLLITGESGVGKDLIARLIHQQSMRKKGPSIEINCGAIPENLLESELFGYECGAFTGALRDGKIGMVELARKGTLFLNEIGELSPNLQVKILKVIQEKALNKIGSTRPVKVDFRLIAATNRDLETMIKEGSFRDDLYYRLNVVPIKIPSLRERKEDILMLITHFLNYANQQYGKQKSLSSRTIDILVDYNWPGNARELRNMIERIVITSEGEIITPKDLPNNLAVVQPIGDSEGLTLKSAKELLEKEMVFRAYERHKTTVGVGKELRISQASAARKVKKHIKTVINE